MLIYFSGSELANTDTTPSRHPCLADLDPPRSSAVCDRWKLLANQQQERYAKT
jgi:hypothetical protein